jgi:DNA-binding beta-propeller fold protein YncE
VFAGSVTNGVRVFNEHTSSIAATIPVGGGPRSIAVTGDGTRAYSALRFDGTIGVIDAQTLQEVDIDPATPLVDHITLQPGAVPFWLAIDPANKRLYASDEVTGVIHIVDIDPVSATFHQQIGTIAVGPAPSGLRGMAINADGTRLYVAAPDRVLFGSGGGNEGKILIVDLKTRTLLKAQDAGLEPYGVTATSDPNVVAFTNRLDDGRGVGILRGSGASYSVSYIPMRLGTIFDAFDVNNASAIVFTPDHQYAFVTGYNRFTQGVLGRDPALGPAGGNVGVIKDPLGPAPQLVAATDQVPNSFPDNLVISADGTRLYAAFRSVGVVEAFDVNEIRQTVESAAASQLTTTPINLINDLINLGGFGGGRPQGLAIQNGILKLVAPVGVAQGDTTPTFTWNTGGIDGVKSTIYISVFPQGKGLFPDDFEGAHAPDPFTDTTGQEDLKDLNRHRIVNGALGEAGTETDFQYTLPNTRALTYGQTYYWGVVAKTPDGRTVRQTGTFTLDAPPPTDLTTFSSVTVLTHGFQPGIVALGRNSLVEDGDWLFDMASQIVEAGNGDLAKNIRRYDKVTGNWVGGRDASGNLSIPEAGKPLVLIADWWRESDINDSGFSEAAADAFFASLVKLNGNPTTLAATQIPPS